MAIALNLRETPPIWPRWVDLLGILLCMVFARSAAMSFNRLADRKIDAKNPRTASRHLPSGRLSVTSVVVFTCVCSLGFVGSTLLFLPNIIPICAAVPVLLFLLGYSYAKRFTSLVHLWLGAALGLSPIAAWVVFRPEIWPLPYPPIMIGLAVMLWTAGFDVIYSCQDADVDREEKLFSLPNKLGIRNALVLALVFHVAMLCALVKLPEFYPLFGKFWRYGIISAAILVILEHWIVRPPIDFRRLNFAFFHLNWIISVGLLLVGVADLVW